MENNKPRLSISEVKQVIDNCKSYGGGHLTYLHNTSYGLDDIYNQYLYNLDSMMGLVDEIILKKGR